VSVLAILGAIVAVLALFALLMVMLGLFLAVPFGTLAYLAIWGFFDVGSASWALGLLLFLKVGAAVLLLVAQLTFLENKGLVTLLLVSMLLTAIVAFLHGFPPRILASITDVIAALVVLVVTAVWALVLLIASLFATFKALKPEVNVA
jgi:hypothetical protein